MNWDYWLTNWDYWLLVVFYFLCFIAGLDHTFGYVLLRRNRLYFTKDIFVLVMTLVLEIGFAILLFLISHLLHRLSAHWFHAIGTIEITWRILRSLAQIAGMLWILVIEAVAWIGLPYFVFTIYYEFIIEFIQLRAYHKSPESLFQLVCNGSIESYKTRAVDRLRITTSGLSDSQFRKLADEYIRKEEPYYRIHLAKLLGDLGDDRGNEYLARLVQDDNQEVKKVASEAIEKRDTETVTSESM